MKISVLGVGSWGSALGMVLGENGHEVHGWGNEASVVDDINDHQTNRKYLQGIQLPKNFTATLDLEESLKDAQMVLVVLPTAAIREVTGRVNDILGRLGTHPLIIHATKGLERGSHLRISEIIEEVMDCENYEDLVVLSGPSHAEEVAHHDLTAVTAASKNLAAAERVQEVFTNKYFRVYTNTDISGVEWGAALKNVIALATGLAVGLGLGDNAVASLITRGLAEIARLGIAKGADPMTFSGLSGVGDLIVTCMSPHSRNWQAGQLLSQGYNKDQIAEKVMMVVEGISTCQAATELAEEEGIEMPITQGLYRILYEDGDVQEVLSELMERSTKQEASLTNSF